MDKAYKIINVNIFEPHKALFKSSRNNKSEYQMVKCCNSDNCDLFKRNECCLIGIRGSKCKYGQYFENIGFTKRARKYYTWISEIKNKYKDYLNKLSSASNKMAIIGDFIYLPYSWMNMNESLFTDSSGLFSKGDCFLPIEQFTVDNVVKICSFKPQAMFGGEITKYQKEEIPKFVKHLSEKFPDLYKELYEKLPHIKEISLTNINRKAYLYTLTPNEGEFIDCHKATWKWDGKYLISTNSRASFMLVSNFSELRMIPDKDSTVTITDDNQVNVNTKFYKS